MWFRLVLRPVLRSVSESCNHHRHIPPGSFYGARCLSSKDGIQDRVYTSEQRDVVIDRLNLVRTDEDVRKLLGHKLATNIETHLHKNGNFTKLEELLKVPAIGPKTIRNVCDKLLGISPSNEGKTTSKVNSGKRSRTSANLVSPLLPDEICATAKILVSIVLDLTSISWAYVDTKTKYLLDWKTVEIDSTIVSLKDIVVKAAELQKLFPDADLYILEDPAPGSMNSRSHHHLKSHFVCSLATSIHNQREKNGDFKLAFVKNKLVEKHFKATVGSETISLQPFMNDVIEQKVVLGRSTLYVPQEHVNYMKSQEPLVREQLSRAVLLAISCIDLVLTKAELFDDVLNKNT
uniref:Transcription elongation factor, mitochondrial n=1 Tax=Lygus hesperus TaxID=30085 RepID=A0A0A9W4P9_LYGHE